VDAVLFWVSSYHVQRANADGAGRAKDRETLQSPYYIVK
jgi:hypothetical protein